jgi:hypothetical protein
MSALPPKADIRERVLDVRFGPEPERRYSITSSASKLQRFGDHETESLGRLRIDHKLPAATCIGESHSKAKEHAGR